MWPLFWRQVWISDGVVRVGIAERPAIHCNRNRPEEGIPAQEFAGAIPGTGRLQCFTVYVLTDSSRSSRASQYCFSRTSVWCFKKNQNSVWPPIQLPYRKDSSKGIPHILLHRYRNGGGVRNSARLGHDIDQSGASIRWKWCCLDFHCMASCSQIL
jgi:hypothetical protein